MLFSVRLLLSSYIHNNNISSVQKCTKVGISNPQPLNYIIIQSKLLSQMQGKQKKTPQNKQVGVFHGWMHIFGQQFFQVLRFTSSATTQDSYQGDNEW